MNIQTEPRPTLSLRTCADVHRVRSRRSREEQHRISVLDNTAIPPCVVFYCDSLDQSTRIRVCLNNVCVCGGRGRLIKVRRTTEQRESPSKTAARTRSQTYFPRTDTCGFKKRKETEKKKQSQLLVMDVFTLTLLQIEHS